MATTKKKTPPKKVSTTKAKVRAKAIAPTWRFYVVTIGIFLVAVTTFVVMAYLTAGLVAKEQNQARLDRINEIYTSLELGDAYIVNKADVFGEKILHEKGSDSTRASSKELYRGDTVSNTVAELDSKIKAAGFNFVNEPTPGTRTIQYHYRSTEGEYIRLLVTSKPYNDAVQNALIMNGGQTSEAAVGVDENAGPALVVLKVNLDGNNE